MNNNRGNKMKNLKEYMEKIYKTLPENLKNLFEKKAETNAPAQTSLRPKKENSREAITALDGFIQQLYWGEGLSPEKTKTNIYGGLVEIVKDGMHSSNGILITTNGYFLTAKHCVENGFHKGAKIRTYDDKEYEIEKICAYGSKEDIALAKANMPGKCETKPYRIYNTDAMQKDPVMLLTRRNGKTITKYGIVQDYKIERLAIASTGIIHLQNQIGIKLMDAEPGDSGGVIISPDGRLMGICTSITLNEQLKSTSGTKILSAMNVVHCYKRKLEGKLQTT